jgi:hypothetical protein
MSSQLESGRARILPREGHFPALNSTGFCPSAPETSKYLPMFHLLKEEDLAFLRGLGQDGIARQLRSRRRRIFRMFLDELAGDAVAVLKKRREEIARGAWYGLEEYCEDVGAFALHITRLYAATALHALPLNAAPEWVDASVTSLLQQLALQPAEQPAS